MGAPTVSVLLSENALPDTAGRLTGYLETTGLSFEVVPVRREGGSGSSLRRALSESRAETIVVVDSELVYPLAAIGDAVAMIESGVSDIVFGAAEGARDARFSVVRWLLVDSLPDPAVELMAFSREAARLVIGETKLERGVPLEIAFLANKYGFRVERLHVTLESSARNRSRRWHASDAVRIRLLARRMAYRASRRCPVCFANEVATAAQIPGNLVRACARCKCRYLNRFSEEEEGFPVRRILRPHPPRTEPNADGPSTSVREKSAKRRLSLLRKQLAPRARVLEVGVRDGSFGAIAAREFEYVGIDHSPALTRSARSRNLEVYCATLSTFVNTGPAFDSVVLFHVLENLADPHDALGRIKELLKPGGVLFLITFDTEGFLYMLTEHGRMAQLFKTHLILYSRSALIELLERSGFEIDVIGPDFDYREHRFLRHLVASRWKWLVPFAEAALKVLPDPLIVGTGSIRIVARRRAGPGGDMRAIRSTEATHAR